VSRAASTSRLRVRILTAAIGVASVVAGVIAGCGIDDVGSFVTGADSGGDARPVLPPGNDGSTITDGGTGTDADADADADRARAEARKAEADESATHDSEPAVRSVEAAGPRIHAGEPPLIAVALVSVTPMRSCAP
jgi:hypothetical protein